MLTFISSKSRKKCHSDKGQNGTQVETKQQITFRTSSVLICKLKNRKSRSCLTNIRNKTKLSGKDKLRKSHRDYVSGDPQCDFDRKPMYVSDPNTNPIITSIPQLPSPIYVK